MKKLLAISLALFMLSAIAPKAVVIPGYDAGTNPPVHVADANDNKVDYDGACRSIKIDSPAPGEHLLFEDQIKVVVSENKKSITVEELGNAQVMFVNMKGGNGYNHYTIPLSESFVYNLQTPDNKGGNQADISHFTIYLSCDRDFTLTKYAMESGDKVLLSGAVFNLYKDNVPYGGAVGQEDKFMQVITVDESFKMALPVGHYFVEEKVAPDGYQRVREPIFFEIGESKKEYTLEVENFKAPTHLLSVLKVDSKTKLPLAGAVFTLEGEGVSSQFGPTTEDGEALFENLKAGTYTLCETVVPDGYLMPKDPCVTVNITEDTVVTITNQKHEVPDTGLFDTEDNTYFIFLLVGAVFILAIIPRRNAKNRK